MSIIRVADRQRYTSIINEAIEDARLSFRARGVLTWLLSKPDGWSIESRAIAAAGSEGRDAIRGALAELEAIGYVRREHMHDAAGRWISVSTIYESAKPLVTPEPEKPAPVNPASVNPASVNPASEIQAISTNYSVVNKARVDQFNLWWKKYPVKKGKDGALARWNRLSEADRAAALEALPNHLARWTRIGGREFIANPPYPAKWLRDGCWQDELDPPPSELGPYRPASVPSGHVWVPSIDKMVKVTYLEELGIDPKAKDLVYGRSR